MYLHRLPQEIEAVNALIDANGGEITPEIEERLKSLEAEAVERSDGIAGWIRSLKAIAEMEQKESAHFAKRKSAHANLADRLSQSLLRSMRGLGKPKLKGVMFTLSDRKSSTPSIRWAGEGDMPAEYRRVTVQLDYDKAREHLKAGKLPPGFEVSYSHWLDIR